MPASHHLFLLRELVKRDFEARYSGSLLGFFWSFAQPVWQLLLFTFVFSGVMRISPAGVRTDHFAVFLFCGLLPWMAVNEGVTRSTTAITDNAPLVKKLRFPSEFLVVSVVATALIHEAIALVLFLVILVFLGEFAWGGLLLLTVAVPVQVALTLGLGFFLASVHVFFRDTFQLLGMLLMGWFYLTPIVYPLSWVPDGYRSLIELNPLTALVGLYRSAVLGGELVWVPGTTTLTTMAASVLALGIWLFRRLKPTFGDEI